MGRLAGAPLLGIVAVLAAVIVLVGCGGSGAGDEEQGRGELVDQSPTGDETAPGQDNSPDEGEVDRVDPDQASTSTDGEVAGDAGDGAPGAEAPDGYLVWVHEREPPDLHVDDPRNDLDVTSWIRAPLLEGLFGVDADTAFYPELLADEPTLSEDDDGTIRIEYRLRGDLLWSDGVPLTAADVAYTHRIMVEGCTTEADGSIINGSADGCVYAIGNRTGYDLVTDFQVVDDTRFTVTMANFYPGWKELYVEVFAAHAFGADAAEVNDNLRRFAGLPSSGPLVFETWDRGRAINLARNDNYHGSTSPDARNRDAALVDGVQVRFVADSDAQIEAVLNGDADVIMTKPRLDFDRLVEADNFTVASEGGTAFEHWGLNLLNPHLAKPQVREALAYALDKREVVAELYEPLFGSSIPADGLGNTYWLPDQAAYVDNQARYAGGNLEAARAALEAAGYIRGADGVFAHPADGRLRLRVGTTGGDQLREKQQILIKRQLAAAGIELIIDNVDGGGYFSRRPFAPEALDASVSGGSDGDPTIWDITQFSWVGGPWPGGQSGAYRGRSRNNPYGYNTPDFDVRASECDATIDETERAACYNELDSFVTTLDQGEGGLFMIPLTQKPSLFGYRSDRLAAVAVAPDVRRAGPLVNVGDYQLDR